MADADEDEELREIEGGAAERLTFFSDAVVAIAMTLLALDLPVPRGLTAAAMWDSAWADRDAYLAFALSFVVIASHWSAHHRLLRWIDRGDTMLRRLNLLWLFFIVLTPWVTRIIAEGGSGPRDTTQPARFAVYAVAQVLIDAVYILLALHLQRAGLLRRVTPSEVIPNALWGAGTIGAAFAVSIPFFFLTQYAWAAWILVPIAVHLTRARLRRI